MFFNCTAVSEQDPNVRFAHTQMEMQRTFPPPLRCDIMMAVSSSQRGAGKCDDLCFGNTLALFQNL